MVGLQGLKCCLFHQRKSMKWLNAPNIIPDEVVDSDGNNAESYVAHDDLIIKKKKA